MTRRRRFEQRRIEWRPRRRCWHHALVAAVTLAALLPASAARTDGGAETGVLRVGTSADYPPFSGEAPAAPDGVEGFDIDVARAYATARGLTLEFVRFRWPDLLDDLAASKFDVAMSGVTVRPERSVAGVFSVPVVTSGAVLLLSDDGRFPDAAALDAAWVRLAVNAGGHLERTARARFPNATLLPIARNDAVLDELRAGRVDAVVTDTVEAPLWQARLPGLRRLGPLTRDYKAYLLRATDTARVADLDRWLLASEADGTLGRMRAEHFGDAAAPVASPLPALLAAVKERLALMPGVAAAKRANSLPVRDPARERRVLNAAVEAVRHAAEREGRPPPAEADVRAFYRAQIEAAVALQEATLAQPARRPEVPADLATALRPALLRIGDRIAALLVRLPAASDPADWRRGVEAALADFALPGEQRRRIADTLVALAGEGAGQGAGQQPGEDGQQQREAVANQGEAQPEDRDLPRDQAVQ